MSAAGVSFSTLTASREDSDPDPVIESVLAVAADGRGRRRRAEALRRSGEEWLADTVVVDGATFWARKGTSVATNDGDPRYSSHGGADFIALLLPSGVPAGFDLAATGESEEVAGRRCAVVSASPREVDPYGRIPGNEVLHMIAGLADFRLWVDLRTGILLKVTKLVDGEVAELGEFTEITLDEPLDDSLFTPPR